MFSPVLGAQLPLVKRGHSFSVSIMSVTPHSAFSGEASGKRKEWGTTLDPICLPIASSRVEEKHGRMGSVYEPSGKRTNVAVHALASYLSTNTFSCTPILVSEANTYFVCLTEDVASRPLHLRASTS